VLLIAGAVRAIDPLELAGIRKESTAQDLQTRGPYHLVRHPLYLGWLLIVFGPALMTGDRLTFAIITSVYLFIAVPWEERSLEQAFGPQYRRYKEEVRWRIVPFLY
jgi:protein-S-isoprenylcysteine O-methyltransferase Ste14